MKQIIRGFVFTFFVILLNCAFLDFSYAQKAKKSSKSSKQVKSSQSTNKSKAAKYISRGKSRIKQKKYSDALSDFRKAHKLFPSKTTQNYIKRLLPIIKKQTTQRVEIKKKGDQAKSPSLSLLSINQESREKTRKEINKTTKLNKT